MEINREALLSALTAVQPGLASREIIEQTQSFIFKAGFVVTYNDEVSVRHPVNLDLEGAVRAEELFKILKRLKATETVDVSVEDSHLVVTGMGKQRKAQAGIVMDAEIKAPFEIVGSPDPADDSWKDLPSNFLGALRFCATTVGKDMTRQLLTCIHFAGNVAESTDAYRITQYKMDEDVGGAFLVPGAVVSDILRYSFNGWVVTDGWLHLRTKDGAVFSCRTYKDEYPDLNRFLTIEGDEFHLPEEMGDIIDRAVVFTSSEDFQVDQFLAIVVKEGRMKVSAKGSFGWFKEMLTVPYKGDGFSFYIHPGFLKEAFSMLRTCQVCGSHLKLVGTNFTHLLNLVVVGDKA